MMFSGRMAVMTVLIVGFVASFFAETNVLARESPGNRTELHRLLDDEGAAWAKGDADAFAAHVREDVVFTNTVGMFSIGKVPLSPNTRGFSTRSTREARCGNSYRTSVWFGRTQQSSTQSPN